jgi:hypothetical protein
MSSFEKDDMLFELCMYIAARFTCSRSQVVYRVYLFPFNCQEIVCNEAHYVQKALLWNAHVSVFLYIRKEFMACICRRLVQQIEPCKLPVFFLLFIVCQTIYYDGHYISL